MTLVILMAIFCVLSLSCLLGIQKPDGSIRVAGFIFFFMFLFGALGSLYLLLRGV